MSISFDSAIVTLLPMCLTASSLSVAASTFLVNQVLTKIKEHALKGELGPLVLLISVLLIFPIMLMIGMDIIILFSSQPVGFKLFLYLITTTPLAPASILLGLILWKSLRR